MKTQKLSPRCEEKKYRNLIYVIIYYDEILKVKCLNYIHFSNKI